VEWVATFAERFKELTKHQTYNQVADVLGVSKATVSYYMSGQRKPKAPMIKFIAEQYGVSPLWLTGGDVSRYWAGSTAEETPTKTSPFSDAALDLARLYDTLDQYGKDAVREVANVEKARCEDELRFLRESEPEPEEQVIDDFTFLPAAGPLLGVAGQERIPYVMQPDDPKGAVYTTRVSGDSMEPYFPDGSRIFVNMDQVRDGDIGVFCVDGATVIKQYHYDPFMGITYLFSLNRKRSDMDVVITPNSGISLFCQGRVITKRHFPVPM
jgi:transcriptional regulator with XRE-family HTH domain